MLTHTLIVVIPGAAIAVAGIAMLGPGAARPFDGVRLWGGPTEGARVLSFRVEGLQRMLGIDAPYDLGEIEVEARADDGIGGSFRGRTRRDGTADVQIPLAAQARGNVRIVVRSARGRTLATGQVARGEQGWGASGARGPSLTGTLQGDLTLRVAAARGVFAAPFRDAVLVEVERQGQPVSGAQVTASAQGGSVADPTGSTAADGRASVMTDGGGQAVIGVTPASHAVEAAIEARAQGLSGSWQGTLPVIPGAMWLDPQRIARGRLRVVSPVPRDTAYATIATRSDRLWGGTIPLSSDPDGFFSGEIAWPLEDDATTGQAWLTLASDPRATGAATIGWPVFASHGGRAEPTGWHLEAREERHFCDFLLLDGMPRAERLEADRRSHARRLGLAALLAAALLEVLLLADTTRAAERTLYRAQASWGDEQRAPDAGRPRLAAGAIRAIFWFVVAAAIAVMAFAGIGVVLLWKTGG